VQEQPELYDRVEALISLPSKKPRKKRKKVDIEVYRRHITGIVHSLDGLRMSERARLTKRLEKRIDYAGDYGMEGNLDRQGRTEEYLALCRKEERHLRYALQLCDLKQVTDAVKYARKHFTAAEESLQVAQRLRESRQVAEALEIGEHGLKLEGPKAGLGKWLGPVEEAQGRSEQALASWLAAFQERPSLEIYKTIRRLAGPDWGSLRLQVMATLRKSHDRQVWAEVLLLEEEWDQAIKVAEGRDVWYPVVETVADGVMPHRPEWVVKISLKHAERLMYEPKSKNYPIAAAWLKRAKQAYKLLGKTDEWQKILRETKEKYKRRPALQNQLARL
jgi:uncharacterized Zn finger protein